MKLFFLIILIFFVLISYGQKLDHTVSFRDMLATKYFRINYDNDFFAASDYNYTQGYNLELVTPNLSKNPLNKLLIQKKELRIQNGLSIEHIGFTPFSIANPDVIFTDRPFASAIMLKSFVTSTDTTKDFRIISGLSIGMIGPVAFGNAMQTAIHKVINGVIPQGWKNQIKNDLVLNYELGFEKKLFQINNSLIMSSNSTVRLGTLFSSASLGFNAQFGAFNHVFFDDNRKRKFQFSIYGQPLVNFIGYDATLQGGVINRNNIYTVKGSEIERATLQLKYGAIVKIKTLFLEYSQAIISKEFSFGERATWGGIKIGWLF